jgi:hypothetical protein
LLVLLILYQLEHKKSTSFFVLKKAIIIDVKRYFYNRKGQAFLALTFFIGGILAVAGILIAFITISYVDTGYGVAASAKAEEAATAGAEDGLLQLDRNAAFSTAVSGPYTVSSASSTTATVSVTQSSPSAGLVTILSAATVSGHAKKISVVVSENASTGQVSVVSWTDIQ